MKKLLTLTTLCLPLLFFAADRPLPEGKAWRKSSSSAGKVKTFVPEWKDNSVVAGNKKVEFCSNGSIRIWVNGQAVLNLHSYYAVKTAKKRYWNAADSKNFTHTVSVNNKVHEIKGVLGIEGKSWHTYTQKAVLKKDGVIHVSISWTPPPADFKWSFTPSFYMTGSYADLGGSTLKCDDKKLVLPFTHDPKTKKQNLGVFTRGVQQSFTFLANIPGNAFTISGNDNKNFVGLWIQRNMLFRQLNFIVYPGRKLSGIEFDIDIRKGVEQKAASSGDIRAGINFKELENLEMPDRVGRNLFINGSFENGISGWMIGIRTHGRTYSKAKWGNPTFNLDDKVGKFGSSSMRINTINPVGDYRDLTRQGNITGPFVVVEPGTYTVSWYAKGDDPGKQVLNVWAPNYVRGNTYVARKGGIRKCYVSKDWKRYSMTIDIPQKDCFFLRLNASSRDLKGSVWIDGIQLEKGGKATAFESPCAEGRLYTSQWQNFINSTDPIDAKLRIAAAPGAKGKVRITLKNFFSEKLFDKTYSYTAGKNGKTFIKLPFTVKSIGKGLFVLRAAYHPEKGRPFYEHHRFTVIDYKPEPFKNRHILTENYECYHASERFYDLLKRWQNIGYGSMAQNTSQTKNKEVIELYRKHNMELITFYAMHRQRKIKGNPMERGYVLTLSENLRDPAGKVMIKDYYRESGGKITPEYLKRFEEASAKIAAAQPWITRWHLGSEMTAFFPFTWWEKGGDIDAFARNYAKLLAAFVRGVRRVNPKAEIVQGGPCNMAPSSGIAEVDRLLKFTNKEGVKLDMIGFHPYRYSPESPDLDADTATAIRMLARHGYGKETKILWDEMMNWGPYELPPFGTQRSTWAGPPRTWWCSSLSYDMGWTEKLSAAWRLRSWLVAFKYADRVASCCSGSTNNFNLDIHLTPFASQISPNILAVLLGNSKFLKDVRFAPYMRAYIFDDGTGRPVAAVWCHQEQVDLGTQDAPVIQADFGNILDGVFDMMNNRRKITPGKMTFAVSGFPLFFRGKKGTAKAMIDSWQKAMVVSGKGMSPLQLSAAPVSEKEYLVNISNFISTPVSGTVSMKPFKLPAAGKTAVKLTFPKQLKKNAVVSNKLLTEIKTDNGSRFNYDLSFDALIVSRTSATEDLNKVNWNRIPEVKFTGSVGKKLTSGSYRIAWSKAGLYLQVDIKDKHFVHQEFANPFKRYSNDCLQVYIDTLANARSREFKGYDEDDYEYMIQPSNDGRSSRVFRVRSVEQQLGLATQAPKDMSYADDIPSTFSRTSTGYTYRVFFPAKYLLPIRLQKGSVFGLALYAPNCDDDTQVGDAKRMISGLTTASDGKGCYNRPHTYPALLLTE